MYLAYWGLSRSPFKSHLDPRLFHQGPTQDEALARLHFLVDERRSLGLLLGEAGGGKSLLLEVFKRQLGQVGRESALINLAGAGKHEFFWLLATGLGLEVPATSTQFALWRAVADHVAANRYQQLATILLLDDADLAHADVIDHVIRLAQLDGARDTRLTIVLTAQNTQLHKLGARLLDLADLRVDLEGWDTDDTIAFVKRSLADAGRSTPIFSPPALARLHDLSAGIPRRVKQLADLALLAGAGQGLVQIEPDTIDAVYQELGVVTIDTPAYARR